MRTGLLGDAILFVRIATFAALVPVIARLPIRRLEALVQPAQPAQPAQRQRIPNAHRAARIIEQTEYICRIGRPLIKRLCMTRGLTLFYFLSRAGIETSLVFGIGKVEGDVAGHCWLVRDGEPYLEKIDPRPLFTQMYSFDSRLSATVPHPAGKHAHE